MSLIVQNIPASLKTSIQYSPWLAKHIFVIYCLFSIIEEKEAEENGTWQKLRSTI